MIVFYAEITSVLLSLHYNISPFFTFIYIYIGCQETGEVFYQISPEKIDFEMLAGNAHFQNVHIHVKENTVT